MSLTFVLDNLDYLLDKYLIFSMISLLLAGTSYLLKDILVLYFLILKHKHLLIEDEMCLRRNSHNI